MLLCLAGPGVDFYAIALSPRPTTLIFIPSIPTLCLSFYFLFQLLDWPVGSNSLSETARVPLGPPAGECVALVHPDIITGFWNTRESNVDHG